MIERTATCRCGQLRAVCRGEPVRVSVCHCLECQKRSGSAFTFQARWPHEQVEQCGEYREWSRTGDSGQTATFRFCPNCGATVTYVNEGLPDLTAVAVGAFADPAFPSPHYSVYESRKHQCVDIRGPGIDHFD